MSHSETSHRRAVVVRVVLAGTVAMGLVASIITPQILPWSTAEAAERVQRTSIDRSADGRATTVLVHGQGSAIAERDRENRSHHHSDLQPTGRFVAKDQRITVTVPAGSPAVQLDIGLDGPHTGLNGGKAVGNKRWDLSAGTTTITSDRDGAVTLVSTASTGSARVEVSGGSPMPTFVRGATSDEQWADEVRRYGDAPLFTIVGHRVFGTFQQRTLAAVPAAVTARVEELDRVVDITDSVYGLDRRAAGYASHKSAHRISIISPDTGGGYANAGGGRVSFQVETGAAADLFQLRPDELWGFWHEVGHTYQTPTYNWSGLGEVLVNVSPLTIQGRTWNVNRLDDALRDYDTFFSKPIADRRFADAGTWGSLFMFDQLRRAFGEDFYSRLNQEMRVDRHLGRLAPVDDAAKQQAFARYAGRVAERDLRGFFDQWGIPLTDTTRAELAAQPSLTQSIWESREYAGTGTEHVVPPMVLPTGELSAIDEVVVVGQRALRSAPDVDALVSADGRHDARVGGSTLSAWYPGDARGDLVVELVNARATRDLLHTTVDVTPGASFEFRGIGDWIIGVLALRPDDSTIGFHADGTGAAHPYFDDEYIGLELRSADDRESLGSWSVLGTENGYALQEHLAARYENGQILVVRHREAGTRLTWFNEDGPQTGRADREQRYRVVDDRLVPAEQPIAAVAGDAARLVRGSAAEVGARFRVLHPTSNLDATLDLTAPDGTIVADADEMIGWVRTPGGEWESRSDLVATRSDTSEHGTTARYRVSWAGADELPARTEIEWRPRIVTPPDASVGASNLRYTLTGKATGESFTATS